MQKSNDLLALATKVKYAKGLDIGGWLSAIFFNSLFGKYV